MASRIAKEIGGEVPSNGAEETVEFSKPYVATIKLEGTADFLFHRYNPVSVAAKGAAAKGSKAKKTDDIETFVYRDDGGYLCIPGEYVRQSIIHAAKYRQDPRSPRKSAMDIYKACLISLTTLASVGKKEWDYEDSRRVVIQRSAVTRTRPALKAGWMAEFQFMVNLPEYVRPNDLHDVLTNAGKLVGLGDFRPSYGRFQIVSFDIGLE
jgi:hypothetical protein